jgi:TnsA endonuclease N terminal/NUMOD3 motif
MIKLSQRICAVCFKLYDPPREKSSYCSRHCQVIGRNRGKKHPDVTLVCAWCKSEFVRPYTKREIETCSRKCAKALGWSRIDKEAFGEAISVGKTGKTHEGVPHTVETKRHLSEMAKIRLSIPENNPMWGKTRTKESREKQSKTRSQRFVDGTYDWKMWCESGYIFSCKAGNKEVFCRSSWEKRAIEMFDADDAVKSVTAEPFSIQYRLDDHLRHYVPDFLVEHVDGRRFLIEIKPVCHVNAVINVTKFAAAREYCEKNGLKFVVWTQKELMIQQDRKMTQAEAA